MWTDPFILPIIIGIHLALLAGYDPTPMPVPLGPYDPPGIIVMAEGERPVRIVPTCASCRRDHLPSGWLDHPGPDLPPVVFLAWWEQIDTDGMLSVQVVYLMSDVLWCLTQTHPRHDPKYDGTLLHTGGP